ncbi:MAG: sulfurtransferase [Actinomycetota bacterium]
MRLPNLLVTPAWLSGHLKHPGVAILDVRWSSSGGPTATRRAYEDGHIPGAGYIDVDRDLAAAPFVGGPGRHPLPTPETFAAKMAAHGIDDEMFVVVYDDVRGSVAARLWWMLWITGHQVALLDGGLEAWTREGGTLERGAPKPRDRALFTSLPWPPDRVVHAGAVDSTIRAGTAPVLDARVEERYRGDVETIDPVAGHIPGARSAAWTGNLDEDGSFLAPEALRARFEALGVTGDAAIAYCGSGVTSCHDLLALRLAGFGDARLYEGSWSDWVHEGDRPVATGPDPG